MTTLHEIEKTIERANELLNFCYDCCDSGVVFDTCQLCNGNGCRSCSFKGEFANPCHCDHGKDEQHRLDMAFEDTLP